MNFPSLKPSMSFFNILEALGSVVRKSQVLVLEASYFLGQRKGAYMH
jgi:hypothetical protein